MRNYHSSGKYLQDTEAKKKKEEARVESLKASRLRKKRGYYRYEKGRFVIVEQSIDISTVEATSHAVTR